MSPHRPALTALHCRAVNYLALAALRERSAARTHNPERRVFWLAAARYARKRDAENILKQCLYSADKQDT